MNDLDRKIKEALKDQDPDFDDDVGGEQSFLEMVAETFHGRRKWLVALTWIWSLAFFLLSIFTAVQFFKVDSTRAMLAWAFGFMFCVNAVAMLKMWYFMEMNKNAVTREVKRLELQIARLTSRLER